MIRRGGRIGRGEVGTGDSGGRNDLARVPSGRQRMDSSPLVVRGSRAG